jgi:ketosteroid isomerase-like protein
VDNFQDNRTVALNFLERMDADPLGDLSDVVTPSFRYYSADPFGKFVRDLPRLAENAAEGTQLHRPVAIRSARILTEDNRVCIERVKLFDIGGAATIPMYSAVLISITDGRVSKAKEYLDSALMARLGGVLKPDESKSVRQNFTLTDGARGSRTSCPAIVLEFLDEVPAQRFSDAAKKVTTDFASWFPGHGWSNWAEITKFDQEFVGKNFNTPFVLNIGSATREGDWMAVEAESSAGTPTGKRYNNHYLFLFKIQDEKIQLWLEYFDTLHTNSMFKFPDYSGDLTKFARQEFSPFAKS